MNLGMLEEEQARRPLSTIRDVNGRVFTQLRVIDFIHSPYIATPEVDVRATWELSLACRIDHPHSFFGLSYRISNMDGYRKPFEVGISFLEDVFKYGRLCEIIYWGISHSKEEGLRLFDINWKKKVFANPDKWAVSSMLLLVCSFPSDRPRIANRHTFGRSHWVSILEEIPEEALFSL